MKSNGQRRGEEKNARRISTTKRKDLRSNVLVRSTYYVSRGASPFSGTFTHTLRDKLVRKVKICFCLLQCKLFLIVLEVVFDK